MSDKERARIDRVLIECVRVDEAVVRVLARGGVWTIAELSEEMGWSGTHLGIALRELTAQGVVKRGRIKGMRSFGYQYAGKPKP